MTMFRCSEDFSVPMAPVEAERLHVSIFSQQLHSSSFILCTARSLGDRGVAQLFDNVVNGAGGGLDRHRAGGAAQASIPGPVPLVQIEVDKGNILELDVFPDIDLRPVQERMDPNVGARRKSGLELIPQLGRLVAEIPIAVLVSR